MNKKVLPLLILTALASNAMAQSYENGYLRSIVLAGGGRNTSHTLTIVAPSLSGSSTLTLPGGNAAGVLTNSGDGTLTWSTLSSSAVAPGTDNTFLITNALGATAWATIATDTSLLGNGIGTPLGINLGQSLRWTAPQQFSNVTLNGYLVEGVDSVTIVGSSTNNDVSSGAKVNLALGMSGTAGAATITGFTDGVQGRFLKIANLTGQTITLANLSVLSSPGNWIYTGTGDLALPPSALAALTYSTELSGWAVEYTGGTVSTVSGGGTGATSLTQNGIVYGNGAAPIQATSAAANSVLVTNGTNVPSLSQTLPSAVQANITALTGMTGAIQYPTALTFDSSAARTIAVARNNNSHPGSGLTVQAGAPLLLAPSGNLPGGDLTLSGGISEGTGTSNIYFQTAVAGSTGNSDNLPTTRLTLNPSQLILSSGVSLLQNGTTRIDASGNGTLASLNLGTPLTGTNGGTGSPYVTFTGATSAHTYTLPDANATLATTANTVSLQSTTPGTAQNGNANIAGKLLADTIGVGTASPLGALDVEGTLIFGIDSITIVGSSSNNDVSTGSKVNLVIGMSGTAGPATITGFTGGQQGRYIKIANLTGQTITLANLSLSSAPGNWIYTGTGDLILPANALAALTYSTELAGWNVEYAGGIVQGVSTGGTGVTSLTSNGIVYGNGSNPIQATAAAANSVLVTDGSNVPSLSQTLPSAVQANITALTGMTGAITYPTGLTFDGTGARSMSVNRNTGTNPGQGLTVQAGAPAASAGSPNLTGGNLTLSSGISEGTGSSSILFQTPIGQGSTSNTDNTPTTKLTLNSSQLILASGVSLLQGGTTRLDASGNGTLASLNLGTPLAGTNGGTGNAYTTFTTGGSTVRTYTLPDANATLLSTATGVELQSSTPGTAQNGNAHLAGVLLADSVGVGTSSPQAGLDVEGSFVLGVDSVTIAGSSTNNNVSPGSKVSVSIGIGGTPGPATITGFSGGVPGRTIKVGNVSGQTITLAYLSGLSNPGNQIVTATQQDLSLPPNSFVALTYLPEFSAWVVEYTGGMTTPIALGGTGQTTALAAFKALAPDTTGQSGHYLYVQPGGGFVWSAAGSGNGSVTSVTGSGGTTGLTLSGGPITTTGTLTLGGTLAIANGGTGATDKGAALRALVPDTAGQTGRRLTVTDTGFGWVTTTNGGGTVTSVGVSGGTTGMSFSNSPITASGSMTMSGTLNVVNGGTGQSSALTQGGVVYGASTTAMGVSSAGTSGQVLTSGGTGAPSFTSSVSGLTITNSSIGSSNPSTGVFTSVTTPTVYGGSAAGSSLNLQSTSSGSPSSDYISFRTGGTEKMRLTATGMGIGVTNPNTGVDINTKFAIRHDTVTITGNTTNNNVSTGTTSELHIGLTGASGPSIITGFAAGVEDQRLRLINLTGQNLTLANQNGGSSTGNQIITGTGSDLVLENATVAELEWDQGLDAWHVDFASGMSGVAEGGTGVTSLTPNGILYGNGSGPLQATAAAANSVLVTDGSNVPSLSQTLPSAVQGNITALTGMTGAITYPTGLTFNGTAARTMTLARNTGTNPGQGLTVEAGAPVSGGGGANNLAGGDLTLASGISEGSSSSNIYFQTPTAGSTGSSDNALATRLTLNSSQLNLASGVSLLQNGTTRIDASGNGTLASLNLGTPLTGANGGTGSAYVTFTGPTSAHTYTLPDANATLATTANTVLLQSSTPGTAQNGNVNIAGKMLIDTIGVGTASPLGALDVEGTLIFGIDSITIVGSSTNNDVSTGSKVNLVIGMSGTAGPATITGFTGGQQGRYIKIANLTGQTITLANLSLSSAPGNWIYTGTGDLVLPANALAALTYSTELAGWNVEYAGGIVQMVSTGGTGVTSLTSNGIVYGNGSNPIQATAAAANSVLVTDGSNVPTLSQTLPSAVQANITALTGMTGAITYPTSLTFDGTGGRTMSVNRNTGTNPGQGLTLQAGAPAAFAGSPNLAGGNLTLSSGISEGTGTSNIYFQTAAAGSSGNGDNTPATRLTLNATQLILASGVSLLEGSTTRLDASGNGSLAGLTLGTASSSTGTLAFANGSNGNLTTLQAGTATAGVTYTLPTAAPTSSGQALTSTTGGAMSWASIMTNPMSASGDLVYGGASGVPTRLAATATANQVLLSGSNAAPAWSTATYPATTTINQILYSNAANTVTGLATANSGILNTNASGVPSIATSPIISGTLQSGIVSSATGGLKLANSASANLTTIQAGNATAAVTYTLPTAAPSVDGQALTSLTSGAMSWASIMTNPMSAPGDMVYGGASGTPTRLAATATASQVLLSGSNAAPSWSTATYPATTTINQLLWSNANNTVTGLTTGNNGVLITSSGGVPSISSTLPSAVQGNITSTGTITSGTWNGTSIAVANGGTGQSSSLTQGGIVYGSSTSAMATSAAGTSGQFLISGGTGAPTWTSTLSVTANAHILTSTSSSPSFNSTGSTGYSGIPTVSGSDVAGQVSVTESGTGGFTAVFNFANSYSNAPYIVVSPSNSAWTASSAQYYCSSTTSSFTISTTKGANSTAYTFNYIVIGH